MNYSKVSNGPAPVPNNAKDVPTACIICSHNCGLRVDVENNQIADIRPDPSNPVSDGYSCNKAQAISHYVSHKQRVTQPLKRQANGSFVPVSWDQAIGEIAEKLNQIRKTYAPRAIAVAGMGGQGNHSNALGIVPFMHLLGSPLVFSALGQEKTQHALVDRRLFRAKHDSYLPADEHHSPYVILMGSNPLISNRGRNATESYKELVQDPNRQLVVVDPRVTETARKADRHIQAAPATDVFVLMGLVATLVQEDLVNHSSIADQVSGYEAVRQAFADINVADMAARCEVDEDALRATAREFAAAPAACISYDLGVEQIPHSTLVSYLIRVLLLLTGNIGKLGGNVFIHQLGPDMPHVSRMPALLESGIEGIPMFAPIPQFPPAKIPEEILSEHPDRIRALIVDGANPLVSYPDSAAFRKAFDALDLLVVIEPAMSETARVADYVLPAPVGYEKWEFSSFPRVDISAQWRPPVVNGPKEALPEPEIYYRLARAMGILKAAPKNLHLLAGQAHKPAGAAAYLAALSGQAGLRGGNPLTVFGRVGFWLYETLGPKLPNPSLSALWFLAMGMGMTRRKEVLLANPELKPIKNPFALGLKLVESLLEHPEGFRVGKLDVENNFTDFCFQRDGKAQINQPDFLHDIRQVAASSPEAADQEFPLVLNGGMRTGWSANTIVRDPSWRKGKGPHYAMLVSVQEAEVHGLSKGDSVLLESRRGRFEVPIKIDKNTRPGHLNIPNIFNLAYPDSETGELKATGVGINELSDADECDPYTGCPYHKRIRCRISKIEVESDPENLPLVANG